MTPEIGMVTAGAGHGAGVVGKITQKVYQFCQQYYLNVRSARCPFLFLEINRHSGTRLGAVLAAQFDAISREQWCAGIQHCFYCHNTL